MPSTMLSAFALCDRGSHRLLEDACRAHGATRDGLLAGAAGIAGAFGFNRRITCDG
jgi:dTDP-4-amino-4,6-dideoxygalactose transaminase